MKSAKQLKKLHTELSEFCEFGEKTEVSAILIGGEAVPTYTSEFWTSKQRAAHSLHEVSYRACFKPQLPKFFIERFTHKRDLVYDPFMGRGTTLLEAALMQRNVIGCDINPLSKVLCEGRLSPPSYQEIERRLEAIELGSNFFVDEDLLEFYHPMTLQHLYSLREYFLSKEGRLDAVDKWIRAVASNRLTGHSAGFFSVYTMPPNQAVTAERQKIINEKRKQIPPFKEIKPIILKKSKSLLKDITEQERQSLSEGEAEFITGFSRDTPSIASETVSLIVTSPPFLDVIDYRTDNWLRCWFNGIDSESLPITQGGKIEDWVEEMSLVFQELHRVLKPGGVIAFEVGEVRGGKILMEELVIQACENIPLKVEAVMINAQEFTKTANCWGVDNKSKGTNTNRIVILSK